MKKSKLSFAVLMFAVSCLSIGKVWSEGIEVAAITVEPPLRSPAGFNDYCRRF